MKAYWAHILEIAKGLELIITQGKLAKHVVQNILTDKRKGSKDRKLVSRAIYEIVKNFRKYENCTPSNSLPSFHGIILCFFYKNDIDFSSISVEGIDFSLVDIKLEELKKNKAIWYSVPDWYYNYGFEQLSNRWDKILEISLEKAPIFIRHNRIRLSLSQFENELKKLEINFEHINESAFRINQEINLKSLQLYKSGAFEIQDIGSQQIAQFCNPKEGNLVIDACAGAGGKSLALAHIMSNHGTILCLDTDASALEVLMLRAKRAGASMIESKSYNEMNVNNDFDNQADIVLCDVPCSASGVLRRETDKKWKQSLSLINELIVAQTKIIDKAAKWVKLNGHLIYATCSVFDSENEQQIELFLNKNKQFKLVKSEGWGPESVGSDGFFMAKFVKIEE